MSAGDSGRLSAAWASLQNPEAGRVDSDTKVLKTTVTQKPVRPQASRPQLCCRHRPRGCGPSWGAAQQPGGRALSGPCSVYGKALCKAASGALGACGESTEFASSAKLSTSPSKPFRRADIYSWISTRSLQTSPLAHQESRPETLRCLGTESGSGVRLAARLPRGALLRASERFCGPRSAPAGISVLLRASERFCQHLSAAPLLGEHAPPPPSSR